MSRVRIPIKISLKVLGDRELPENIVFKYSFRAEWEALFAIYKRVKGRTYELFAIEYVPGFVQIQRATVGCSDYKPYFEKELDSFVYYDTDLFKYKRKFFSADLIYDLDTQVPIVDSFDHFINHKEYPCFWRKHNGLPQL